VANYNQLKNAAILTPATNTDLGSASNKYGNLYLSGNLTLGSTVVNSSNAINPKVNSITYPGTETATDTAGGEVITLNGTGFQNPCAVLVGSVSAGTVTFISSTQITFVAPAMSANTYVLYLINSDGGTAIVVPGISYSGTPTWSTSAGSLGSVYETSSISTTVTATGDAPITYVLASGTLPTGSTLSSGTLSGTASATASSTTYNFTISAKDAQNQTTNRAFSLTINPDVVTWNSPADNTTTSVPTGTAIANVTMSATSAAGKSITYTANSLPTGLSISGANIIGTPTVGGTSSSLITATAATTGRAATRTFNWAVSVTSGQLWLWGGNQTGQLGDNTRVSKSSPIQTISGGSNWKQISNGFVAAAIKTDGTLWTWGRNSDYGQGGIGDLTERSSPTQIYGGGTNWKQVSTAVINGAAIKTDDTLWVWGFNYPYGIFGTGSTGPASPNGSKSPTAGFGGGAEWAQVAVGGGYHIGAIKTNGTMWMSGYNGYGQLGTNNNTNYSSPVQIAGGGTTWSTLSLCKDARTPNGCAHAAIKTDGTLWVWGRNAYGQLGINNTTPNSSPVQTVSGGTTWKQVNAHAGSHMFAIKTDGTLWGWGKNSDGELGDGTVTNKSSPVQTISGGTNWSSVATAWHYSAAIKTDGTLWAWGANGFGQLGDGTTVSKSSPVQTVMGGSTWLQVSCNGSGIADFIMAIAY